MHPKIKKLEEWVEKSVNDYSEAKLTTQELMECKIDKDIYEDLNVDIQKKVKNLHNEVIKIENMILTTDNYVEKYVPLNIERQVSEVMNFVMNDKIKKRMEAFFKRRMKILHSVMIEDKGNPDILKEMREVNEYFLQEEGFGEVPLPSYVKNLLNLQMEDRSVTDDKSTTVPNQSQQDIGIGSVKNSRVSLTDGTPQKKKTKSGVEEVKEQDANQEDEPNEDDYAEFDEPEEKDDAKLKKQDSAEATPQKVISGIE